MILLPTSIRYAAIALACALLHIGILLGGDALALHYAASTVISFIACVLAGYSLHSRYTFGEPVTATGLVRYTVAMLLNFPLSLVAIWFAHDVVRLPMLIAAPLSTAALVAWNFVSSRWAIRAPVARPIRLP